jgi:hypothetical protein
MAQHMKPILPLASRSVRAGLPCALGGSRSICSRCKSRARAVRRSVAELGGCNSPCLMGRLRACCRLRRLLAPPPQAPPPGHHLARWPHGTATHASPFSRHLSSASAAVAPHDARDSGFGGSAYWAWIRAATESAPAPALPQEEEDEGPERYIPVKAYFLSTR